MWRKIRLDAENARPVAFQRSKGHRRSGRSVGCTTIREIFSISIFGGGLWISSRFGAGRNQRSKRRAMIVSEAKGSWVSGLDSVWMRKSEKLALSVPGEGQLGLTS